MLLTLLSPQGAPGSVVANLTATLDAVSLSSDATVVAPPVTANLSVTLGELSLSSSVTVSGVAVSGYGVGGPFVSDAYLITGVAGVPPPVVAVVRQTH